ncbi:hypothetical protein C8F01DRAFT_599368 [Mycena amicta]|nr:hypothetical protein C8F01DRAFT_599368 [Mycena amicta]
MRMPSTARPHDMVPISRAGMLKAFPLSSGPNLSRTSLSDKPISPLLLPVNGKAVKRGRYALQSSPIHTKFQIDPARNSGLGHKFAEVVRGKARESLPAHDCPECTEYYDAIGIMPPRLHAPLWRSPSSPPHSRADHVCMHKNDISRHRAAWSPAKTPPGYWNIGFPDSEEVKRINTRAATMREEKEQFMSREAAKPKGRYRKHK